MRKRAVEEEPRRVGGGGGGEGREGWRRRMEAGGGGGGDNTLRGCLYSTGQRKGGVRLMCDCNVCVCIYASVACVVGVSVCIVE